VRVRRPGPALLLAGLLAGCASRPLPETAPAAPRTLKDAFAGAFLVGAALSPFQFSGIDTAGARLVAEQFNSVSPENVLKWESVHPRLGAYTFAPADRYVDFGAQHRMFIVGHTLVWHNQTPSWVFNDSAGHPVSRDTLIARMRDHILTVVGRYRGRVGGWDVVNEALDDEGGMRRTPWDTIIGDEYVAMAFRFAHEADPGAELYYNDYSVENAAKRRGVVALVRRLQSEGVPVTGVGIQGHYRLDWPSPEQLDTTIAAFAALGVKVMITELDVDVLPPAVRQTGADVALRAAARPELNPWPAALPDSMQQVLARRYAELFGVLLKHAGEIGRVTFWGVTDAGSWKNNWPVPGRTNYPLLFDRQDRPKPAFDAVLRAARQWAGSTGRRGSHG
jgi:endo-1,4-beta-xylanase